MTWRISSGRLREVWPDIDLDLRADSGFAVSEMFDTCERLRLWDSIGYGMNAVLKRNREDLLDNGPASRSPTFVVEQIHSARDIRQRGERD